jgi:hypothetical protein
VGLYLVPHGAGPTTAAKEIRTFSIVNRLLMTAYLSMATIMFIIISLCAVDPQKQELKRSKKMESGAGDQQAG